MSKIQLRKKYIYMRNELNQDLHQRYCEMICDHLKAYINTQDYHNIALFYPKGKEVNLTPLCQDRSNKRSYFLPVVKPCNTMDFYRWEPGAALCPNKYGILEPEVIPRNIMDYRKSSLVIAPALLVSHDWHRLGYGGGYYDRFFAKHPNIKRMVALFHFSFRVNANIHEKHDVQPSLVCTEQGVFYGN